MSALLIPQPVRERVVALPGEALPAYLYDLRQLRAHAAAVRAALPEPVELYYAAKANAEPALLAALASSVTGYEVSSGGEVAHLRRAVPGMPLAFGGPGKTPGELAQALLAGVECFHVESETELHMLGELSASLVPGRPVVVMLRVNLALSGGALHGGVLAMGGGPTPFGVDPDQAERCAALLVEGNYPQLELRGVHAHLASGLDAGALVRVADQVVAWALGFAGRHKITLAEVNVGGGMAVDYTDPEARFDWANLGAGLRTVLRRHPGLRLRIEPGRALTAYCGWYATQVLDVKLSHGRQFAVLSGGTHHLRTPAAKQHDQPCAVLPMPDWPHPWPRARADRDRVTLVGQLCTPKDVLARDVPLGRLSAGDRVVFAMAGAYAWNISHHGFLMHPEPTFHVLDAPPEGGTPLR